MAEGPFAEDVTVGDELPPLLERPTTRCLVMYAGASGDFYEIHYDQSFARGHGLPGVVVHGALKSAYLGRLVCNWMGAGGTLLELTVRYREMDVVGDTLTCRGVVTERSVRRGAQVARLELWIENGADIRTTTGAALVALPSRPSLER